MAAEDLLPGLTGVLGERPPAELKSFLASLLRPDLVARVQAVSLAGAGAGSGLTPSR